MPTPVRLLLVCGAAAVASAPRLAAQRTAAAPAPRYREAFVLRRGTDTVAVERFTRTATLLLGALTARAGGRVTYRATLGPGATVTRLVLSRFAADPASTAPPEATTLAFGEGVVQVVPGPRGGRAPTFPSEPGAVPFLNPSFALTEQIIRRSRALAGVSRRPAAPTRSAASTTPAPDGMGTDRLAPDSTALGDSTPAGVRVPVFATAGGETSWATVADVPPDSVTLTVGGVEIRAAVDARGAVRGASVPAQQLVLERVPLDARGRLIARPRAPNPASPSAPAPAASRR